MSKEKNDPILCVFLRHEILHFRTACGRGGDCFDKPRIGNAGWRQTIGPMFQPNEGKIIVEARHLNAFLHVGIRGKAGQHDTNHGQGAGNVGNKIEFEKAGRKRAQPGHGGTHVRECKANGFRILPKQLAFCLGTNFQFDRGPNNTRNDTFLKLGIDQAHVGEVVVLLFFDFVHLGFHFLQQFFSGDSRPTYCRIINLVTA